MENYEIRLAIHEANLKFFQVAKKLNIDNTVFSKKLRYELSAEEKQKILEAIRELKEQIYKGEM